MRAHSHLLVLALLFLTACGGGGPGGEPTTIIGQDAAGPGTAADTGAGTDPTRDSGPGEGAAGDARPPTGDTGAAPRRDGAPPPVDVDAAPVDPSGPIDDGAWPDPTWAAMEAPMEAPPAPRYGTFPEAWFQLNRDRYGRDNVPRSILAIGDSISESQAFLWVMRWAPYAPSGISDSEGYVHLPKELAALSGQLSSWGRDIAPGALAQGRPEVASILFGTNDLVQRVYDPGSYRANIEAIVDACIARGTLPILMTLPPLYGDAELVEDPNRIVREISQARQIPLFDMWQLLVDRGDFDDDLPDEVHPDLDAYVVINREWIALYKWAEHHVLAPARAAGPDPVETDRALEWERAFVQDFAEDADLSDWRILSGGWSVAGGALVGRAAPDGSAALLAPGAFRGNVRVEIVAESDGAEISMMTHNAGDEALSGYYFGFGTNGGARTAINADDGRVGEVQNVRPEPDTRYVLRAWRTPRFVRWGADGVYRLTLRDPGADRAGGVGLYTWAGTLRISRIVVWTAD